AAGAGDDQDSVDTGPAAPPPTEATSTPSTTTTAPIDTTTTTTIPPGPPSQSPEDAARDGIPAAVADLSVAARVTVEAEVAAPEGRWTLSTIEDSGRLPCQDVDPYGVPGVERFCGWEEVLLRDEAGTILRAHPMWEMTPSWIHLTPDAVLGGRVGDGGQPSSTLFRIDRETLELTGVVFPAPDGEPVVIGPGGLAPTTAEDWRLAPDDVSVDDLVTTGPDAVGTDVTSTIGVVRVDVAAVEALLAG
ncbi:MAG TPA: hypothetical protein VFU19_15865, partial [Iamia sp.]|nr:hypothetical protein [Iamia sp.]